MSPDAEFWKSPLQPASLVHELSWNTKNDIIQAYLLLKRCEEELIVLSEEKQNALSYWLHQMEVIKQQLTKITDSGSLYNIGARALLHKYLHEIEIMYSTTLEIFSEADGVTPTDTCTEISDSDAESLSDYED